ncbi:hypothetical protein EDD16DRAFT_1545845, partial [Pisolithus croceorrhizus]
MAGANYMGGKRNAVRAKTRDAVGRAQKRHFVKQRLANALGHCSGDGRNSGPSCSASLLSEIPFAHVPHNIGSKGSQQASHVSPNQFYMSSSDNENDRKRPSKVLSALDTSDHMSIRAAIDRILQLPDLVGAQVKPKVAHQDAVPCRDTRMTDEYGANDKDLPYDTEHFRRQEKDNTDGWTTAWSDGGYANSRTPFCTPGPLWTRNNRFSPLPGSSPFTTDSSMMDVDPDVILEFESSPRLPPSPIAEWSDNQFAMFGQRLQAAQCIHPSQDTGDGSDLERFQHLPRISIGSDEFSGSMIQSSPQLSSPFLPPQPTFQGLEFSDSPNQVHGIHETQLVKDNPAIVPMTDLPLDFLADPDPWTTIGRILQVEHLQATFPVASSNGRPIEFTKGREGVGHPSQAERCVSSSVSMGSVLDTSANETGVESQRPFGDSSRSPPRIASSVGSVRNPLQDALAHDLDAFDDGVELSQPLRSWPSYLDECGPTYGVGAQAIGGQAPNELECRVSSGPPGEGFDVVYDGPCLFGDSDPE